MSSYLRGASPSWQQRGVKVHSAQLGRLRSERFVEPVVCSNSPQDPWEPHRDPHRLCVTFVLLTVLTQSSVLWTTKGIEQPQELPTQSIYVIDANIGPIWTIILGCL